MAITDSNEMVMPVAPMYGGGFGGGMGNNFGGDWGWIILLLLIAGNGWGNGFGGGFGGGADAMFPWLMTGQAGINANTNAGFDNAALVGSLSGIQSAVTSGFGDVQTALCGGFAGVNASIANGFAQSEIADNARQMANMQQLFGLSQQFADCCCENRLASADLKYTVATENCADRYEAAQNTRDIIDSQTRGTQTIIDKLCQLELNAKNDRISDLERQLTMANLAASQNAQTAQILANNEAQTTALEQYLAPVPRPAYVVQNPNCCAQSFGCGCGCGVA